MSSLSVGNASGPILDEFVQESVEEIANNKECPEDARIIARVLLSMGVKECEPRVINQLLEFAHRYTTQVLTDSLVYADHAGRSQHPQVADVQFAIKMRVDEYPPPPSIELLFAVANETNSLRLPPIPKRFGLFLPPDALCLTEVNYQVEPKKRPPDVYNETDMEVTNVSPSLLLTPRSESPMQKPRIIVVLNDPT